MIRSVQSDFPFAGSIALLDGHLWRVHRHNADGTIAVYRDDCPSASFHRTVDLAELTDPGSVIARREDAPLAVRLALRLKALDAVPLADAIDLALLIRAEHRLSIPVTPARVCAILADLGWRRARTRGRIVWLRGQTTLAAAPNARPARRRAAA